MSHPIKNTLVAPYCSKIKSQLLTMAFRAFHDLPRTSSPHWTGPSLNVPKFRPYRHLHDVSLPESSLWLASICPFSVGLNFVFSMNSSTIFPAFPEAQWRVLPGVFPQHTALFVAHVKLHWRAFYLLISLDGASSFRACILLTIRPPVCMSPNQTQAFITDLLPIMALHQNSCLLVKVQPRVAALGHF